MIELNFVRCERPDYTFALCQEGLDGAEYEFPTLPCWTPSEVRTIKEMRAAGEHALARVAIEAKRVFGGPGCRLLGFGAVAVDRPPCRAPGHGFGPVVVEAAP